MLSEFKNASAIRLQLMRKRRADVETSETAILETMINPVIVINDVWTALSLSRSSFFMGNRK